MTVTTIDNRRKGLRLHDNTKIKKHDSNLQHDVQ